MRKSDQYLEDLFEKARTESPVASFEEVSVRFSGTLSYAAPGTIFKLLAKYKLFTIGIVSVATLTLVNVMLSSDHYEKQEPKPAVQEAFTNPIIQQPPSEVISPLSDQEEEVDLPLAPLKTQKISDLLTPANIAERETISLLPPVGRPEEVLSIRKSSPSFVEIASFVRSLVDESSSKTTQAPEKVVKFTISESTSTRQLASISAQAQKAGIEYTYVVDLKKKLIQEFNVDMAIRNTDIVASVQVCVPRKDSFTVSFGWFADANGKAIRLLENVHLVKTEQKHPLQITMAREINQLYLKQGIRYIETHFEALTKNASPQGGKDRILNTAGYLFMKQQAFDQAIEIFRLNTQLFPRKANPWDSLGEAYFKSGNPQKALKSFQQALSIDPKLFSSKQWIEKIMAE